MRILIVACVSYIACFTANASLVQLTGLSRFTKSTDFGDPSTPVFDSSGVTILTTGGFVVRWQADRKLSGEARFFAGAEPLVEQLQVAHPDGTRLDENRGEDIWDPSFENGFLFGSVMIPQAPERNALWPRDAWTRRTFAFTKRGSLWVRDVLPFFDAFNPDEGWLSHNYGHEFFTDASNGQRFVFYEKVTNDEGDRPMATDLYVRPLRDFTHTSPNELRILEVDRSDIPAFARRGGGKLAEGPRPFQVGEQILVSFSAGDYDSDSYGIHLLWANDARGPFQAYLNPAGNDLEDFGAKIRQRENLTWGPGRAVFFARGGRNWVVFHAVKKPFDPEREDGHRQLFLTPVLIDKSVMPPGIELAL